jgi:hypothetical protein
MRERVHALKLPNRTACGREGRLQRLGHLAMLLTEADLSLRLGDRNEVTCKDCLLAIAKHGYMINWTDVPSHAASAAKEKRRRHRRRTRA